MRRAPTPGFWLVARRECRWLLQDRAALILAVIYFALAVMSAMFVKRREAHG
jgi:ABC-2 type transport system permease protein